MVQSHTEKLQNKNISDFASSQWKKIRRGIISFDRFYVEFHKCDKLSLVNQIFVLVLPSNNKTLNGIFKLTSSKSNEIAKHSKSFLWFVLAIL